MLQQLGGKVPGVVGLGDGLTSAILPLTTEPAGITTRPEALRTSSTTRAVNASPTFAVREEMVSEAAMSTFVPTPSRAIGGGAGGRGGAGGGLVRFVGLRVASGGVGRWCGTSRCCPVDSAGGSCRLQAGGSLA